MIGIQLTPREHINQEPLVSLPWLRRKQSSWSLLHFNKNKNRVESIDSQSTHHTASEEEEEEDIKRDTPPPMYDHESHPWAYHLPLSVSNRQVIPREEEGKETLPEYQCTVEKSQFMLVKCENSLNNIKSKNRSWKYIFIVLQGTVIRGYSHNPVNKKNPKPLWSYSMQNVEVSQALDYVKYRNVMRLKIENGPHFLVKNHTEKQMTEWISLLESSLNISTDLDSRRMPLISTQYRRRNRDRNNGDYRSANDSLT
ncbi:hypothetical protein BDB01DRAFT_855450 [Pilobolus umbonatus]|nr:hypothetical protein BDB01DRAFT_855450 [Pilobolus umbonatus]